MGLFICIFSVYKIYVLYGKSSKNVCVLYVYMCAFYVYERICICCFI